MRPGESLEGSRSAHGRCMGVSNLTHSGADRCLAHLSRRTQRVTTKTGARGTKGRMTAMRCFLWSLVMSSLSSRAEGKKIQHPPFFKILFVFHTNWVANSFFKKKKKTLLMSSYVGACLRARTCV